MNRLYFLITIIRRELGELYFNYFHDNHVCCSFAELCNGTAQEKMLDLLGVEQTEKIMLQAIVNHETKAKLMKGFVSDMGINMVGNGIAVSIPIDGIGDESGMNYLLEGQEKCCNEVNEMDNGVNDAQYALVIAITRGGYAEMVMDAARKVDVKGGTVVHGKGIGDDFSAKFFGISIASEMELVYIVTKRKNKDELVNAINQYAGMKTEVNTAVLTLPVEDVVGLRSVSEE